LLLGAKDIWLRTKNGDPLNITAIVRVFVSEQLLLGFLRRSDEIARSVKDKLDIPLSEDHDENLEPIKL
jgi:hypothetical protein